MKDVWLILEFYGLSEKYSKLAFLYSKLVLVCIHIWYLISHESPWMHPFLSLSLFISLSLNIVLIYMYIVFCKVSQSLVEMQIENNKIREDAESNKFELTNKVRD